MNLNFVIATAGHVDHGKSALVKALTGTDPDRLPEEKARQITIDLGFAHLQLSASTLNSQPSTLSIALIDVPGHEDFVRNMVAGVGSIDLALLVVAADDGWMPQTEEHLQILEYLGVSRAVVALTKSDLGNVSTTTAEIRTRLQGSLFHEAPIIPTSVPSGDGIEELKRALARELSSCPGQRDIGKPRLFVDRAFILHGIGTIVTGTLTGGSLRRGDAIIIQPQRAPGRIRSVQSYGHEVPVAQSGMRTALNLPDLKVGAAENAIARGEVITSANFESHDTLDILVQQSERLPEKIRSRALKNGTAIDVHHGTARVAATIAFMEPDASARSARIAQLRLASPLPAFLGDRLVLRDRSQQRTLAGGIVLDPDGNRTRFRSAAQRYLLERRAASWSDPQACLLSEIERGGALLSDHLLSKSQFSAHEIAEALRQLETGGSVVVHEPIVALKSYWQDLRARAIAMIDQQHAQHPEQPGLDLSALRALLSDLRPEIADALILDLCHDDFVQSGQSLARTSHRAALPPHLGKMADTILTSLSSKPFDPPPVKQLAPDRDARETIRFLIKNNTLIEISADLVLERISFEKLKELIAAFITRHGPASASLLRQELQTSRRVIIPLLEYLDRAGFTRRIGNDRILAH